MEGLVTVDSTIRTILTEADLLQLGAHDRRFEVIDGEIVDMSPVGIRHMDIGLNVFRVFDPIVQANKLGVVRTDGLIFVLYQDAERGIRTTRIPDVSFVRKGRLPQGFDRSRPFPGAPDLAVEIVSPDESADDLLAKIRDYLTYGTEHVLVLYPEQVELHQYIQGEKGSHIYAENDMFSLTMFPGLQVRVGDLFVLPED
ncbi:MAG: Uma2 family endonuclease [Anaerolineae bacterium]